MMIDENDRNTLSFNLSDSHEKEQEPVKKRGRPLKNKAVMSATERKQESRRLLDARILKAVQDNDFSMLTEADCLHVLGHKIFGKFKHLFDQAVARLLELREFTD